MDYIQDFIKIHITKIETGDILADYYHYYDLNKNIKFNKDIYYNNIDLIFNRIKYGRTRNDSRFSDSYNMYRNTRFSIESLNNDYSYESIAFNSDNEYGSPDSIWENEKFYGNYEDD